MNDDFQDELISAYLDDELSPEDRSRVERRLADDDEARRMVDELRQLRDDIRSLPRHQLESDFAQRVLRSAEREMLASRPQEPGSSGKDGDSTVRRRDRNEHRRLNIRGLLWTGVAIACAVIIGIEFSQPDREHDVPVANRGESAPAGAISDDSRPDDTTLDDRRPDNTDKIDHLAGQAFKSKSPAANHASDKSVGFADSLDQDTVSASEDAESREPKSKTSNFPASPALGRTRDKAQAAGDRNFRKSLAGEAQDDRAPSTRSGLRHRRLVRPDRPDALGIVKETAKETVKETGSLLAGGPVYVVTVDLTSEATSQQAWFATLKKLQVFDENDHRFGLIENEKLASADQVYSVSLPQSRAAALIAALQERRDSFGVTVHTSSLPELAKDEKAFKKSEDPVRSLKRSASSPAESSKGKPKVDEGLSLPRKEKMRRWVSVDGKAARGRAIDPTLAKRGSHATRKKADAIAGAAPKGGSPRRLQSEQPEQQVMLFFVLRAARPEAAAAAESAPAEADTDQ